MLPMHIHTRRRHARAVAGKKIVYITEFRNAAVEVMKEYQRKGHLAGMEREADSTGQNMYVVYIYPRD